jgi:hypothetical protein
MLIDSLARVDTKWDTGVTRLSRRGLIQFPVLLSTHYATLYPRTILHLIFDMIIQSKQK